MLETCREWFIEFVADVVAVGIIKGVDRVRGVAPAVEDRSDGENERQAIGDSKPAGGRKKAG